MEVYDSLPRGLRDVLKDDGLDLRQISIPDLLAFYDMYGAEALAETLRALKRG